MTKADTIIARLTEIRDLLKTPMLPEPSIEEAMACAHPEDKRTSLKAMGTSGEHYFCRACSRVVQTSSL